MRRIATKLTARLFDMLNPGGRLVLANFLPNIWCAGFMENVHGLEPHLPQLGRDGGIDLCDPQGGAFQPENLQREKWQYRFPRRFSPLRATVTNQRLSDTADNNPAVSRSFVVNLISKAVGCNETICIVSLIHSAADQVDRSWQTFAV